MRQLRYTGGDKVRRINGRPLLNGEIIDDPKLVRDLEPLADFELIDETPDAEEADHGIAE